MTMFDANTYPALLHAAADAHPDKVFLHAVSASGENVVASFRDFEMRSQRVAAGLLTRGIGPGDRVAIAAPNQIEWLELFFGATRIGAVVVTLNVRYREHELEYMLNQSQTRMIVSSANAGDFDFESFYAGFRGRIPTVEEIFFLGPDVHGQSFSDLLAEPDLDRLAALEARLRPEDPALILYTSGTTGKPKGATLTHASLLGSARAQNQHLETTADDVWVCVLPLNHVGGITCTISAAFLTGSTVVLEPMFSPAGMLAAIDRYKVTLIGGVPTMMKLMIAHESLARTRTGSVRMIIIGGSNLEPALANQVNQAFPSARIVNLYGLSEVSGAAVISAADDSVEIIARSIGVTLPGIESRVAGADGNEVPDGNEGELLLRGPGTAAGYWQMPGETAQTFLADDWLATGDMVSRDPDGHINVLGRRKEMFLQGGYNVYPVEVENVLTAHPAVAMAAGIGVPDEVLGEIGCYFIVLKPGAGATAEELRDYCAERLADYKVPRRFIFAATLPMTPVGKIAKAALRKQYDADTANTGQTQ